MQHETDILKQIQVEVKGLKEDADRNHQSVDDRLKSLDEANKTVSDGQKQISDRLDGLEQKFDRMGETQESAAKSHKSAGELVVEALKAAPFKRSDDKWALGVSVKDDPAPADPVIDTTTGVGLARPAYRETFKGLPRRSTLLSILPETIIQAGSIEIPREKAITGDAAVVPEKQPKPYIGIETEKVLLPMKTIAALAKITEQMLEDGNENAVRDHIDLILAHKCDLELERQVITGTAQAIISVAYWQIQLHINALTAQKSPLWTICWRLMYNLKWSVFKRTQSFFTRWIIGRWQLRRTMSVLTPYQTHAVIWFAEFGKLAWLQLSACHAAPLSLPI